MKQFPATRIAASVEDAEYLKAAQELTSEGRSRRLASQYEICGISCFVMCAYYAKKYNYRDRIATVFDEGNRHRHQFETAHIQAKRDRALEGESLARVFYDTLIKKAPPHPLALLVVREVWTQFKADGLEHMIRGPVIKNVLRVF